MATFSDLELKIVRWGEARKIVQNSNVLAQAHKTLEEVGEKIEAAAKLDLLAELIQKFPEIQEFKDFQNICERVAKEYVDAVGDVGVTQLIGCATADITYVECLEKAFNEIKDRKGHLRPDGVFVKET